MSEPPLPNDPRTGAASPAEQAAQRFARAWQQGEAPSIDEYLFVTGMDVRALLIELVQVDLEMRLEAGEAARVENYLKRYPDLGKNAEMMLQLIGAEFTLRRRRETDLSPEEFSNRFPDYKEHLSRRLEPAAGTPATVRLEKPPELPDIHGTRVDGLPQIVFPPSHGPHVPGYEILGILGRGGMGIVYKARHLKLNRIVALKMILDGVHAGAELLERFRREAEAVARLQHPNIVQIYEVGEVEGRPFFSLEYVSGGSLSQQLAGRPLPARQAAALVETLSRAMQVAHERGIVHRDLKPANVLLMDDGTPKITDFGLAKQLEDESSRTRTGAVMGTPSYMAPEQAGSRNVVGPPADVYALGAVLYEALTGRPPFRGSDLLETLEQVRHQDPASPRILQPRLPRDLETICLKCLQKEPGKRFPSALELAEDLRRFLNGAPVRARPVGALDRGWRWCRRNPAAAGLLVTLWAGIVVASYFGLQAERRADEAIESAGIARAEAARADRNAAAADANASRANYRAYIADMRLAPTAWHAAQIGMLHQLLEAYRPEAGRPDLRGFEWHYWDRLCHSEVRRLQGHGGRATCVRFSPDGRLLASASVDRTVKLWEVATGQELLTLRGHSGPVWQIAFSPDGKTLASCGGLWNAPGKIKIWEVGSGKELFQLPGQRGCIYTLAFSPDGTRLASGGAGDETQSAGAIKIWDLGRRQEVVSWPESSTVACLAFSPDGQRLGCSLEGLWRPGAGDHAVHIRDATTGKQICACLGHLAPVLNIAFSPDGRALASASEDRTARMWEAATGRNLHTLEGHRDAVLSVAFSPDGRRLASGGRDFVVKLWDTAKDRELFTIKEGYELSSLAFSPGGRLLASASFDKTVKIWDATLGQEPLTVQSPGNFVVPVAFSADGSRLTTDSVGGDMLFKSWDTATGQLCWSMPRQAKFSDALFSPDGKALAVTCAGEVLKIVDATTARELLVHPEGPRKVNNLQFSPDGKRLGYLTFRWDDAQEKMSERKAKVIDVASGRELFAFEGVTSLEFSPDGKQLAVVDERGRAQFRDGLTGENLRTLPGQKYAWIRFSPDGRWLACASMTDLASEITVRDARTFQEHQVFPECNRFWFSPDGQLSVVRDFEGVKVLRQESGAGAGSVDLRGSRSFIGVIGFGAQGRLSSASHTGSDYEIILWDSASGETTWKIAVTSPLGNFADQQPTSTALFSADGTRLAVPSAAQTVSILDGRPLTDETRWQREALGLYRFHADKLPTREQLIHNIRHETGVSEPARRLALAMAQRYRSPPPAR